MTTNLVYFDNDKFVSFYKRDDTPIERFVFHQNGYEYQIIRYDGSNSGMVVFYGLIGTEVPECTMLADELGEALYQRLLKDIIENPPSLEDSPLLVEGFVL